MRRYAWPLDCLFSLYLCVRGAGDILSAGASKVDITPEGPVALDGYQEPEKQISQGIHDRLYVRVVALESGSKSIVLVACDLTSFMFAGYFRKGARNACDTVPKPSR
jgi:hypothetical protein